MDLHHYPKAVLFWMTREERMEARLSLSATRWAVLAALASTLATAPVLHLDRLALMIYGSMVGLSLAAGAMLTSQRSSRWLTAPWPRWTGTLFIEAATMLAFGFFGCTGAGKLLSWLGHPSPVVPGLDQGIFLRTVAAGYLVALAGCGAWAAVWRWKLRRPVQGR